MIFIQHERQIRSYFRSSRNDNKAGFNGIVADQCSGSTINGSLRSNGYLDVYIWTTLTQLDLASGWSDWAMESGINAIFGRTLEHIGETKHKLIQMCCPTNYPMVWFVSVVLGKHGTKLTSNVVNCSWRLFPFLTDDALADSPVITGHRP